MTIRTKRRPKTGSTLDIAAGLPLQVFGRWEQGRVYDPSSLVFKDGRQWISTLQTASEPGFENAAWRPVKFPRISEERE